MVTYDPIETSTPYVDGQVVTIFVATAVTNPQTVSLPADAPKIDLRVENPVLGIVFFDTDADANSECFYLTGACKRGSAADTALDWAIMTYDSISIQKTNGEAGFFGITYIAFGAKQT